MEQWPDHGSAKPVFDKMGDCKIVDTNLIIPVTALYNSGAMTDIQYDEAMRLVNELENVANEPKTPHEAVAPQHDHDALTA